MEVGLIRERTTARRYATVQRRRKKVVICRLPQRQKPLVQVFIGLSGKSPPGKGSLRDGAISEEEEEEQEKCITKTAILTSQAIQMRGKKEFSHKFGSFSTILWESFPNISPISPKNASEGKISSNPVFGRNMQLCNVQQPCLSEIFFNHDLKLLSKKIILSTLIRFPLLSHNFAPSSCGLPF